MVRENKILQGQGKVNEFYFELGKLKFWRKVREKLNYDTFDLIPLKWLEETFQVTFTSLMLFIWDYIWHFYIYLVREILFLSRKSQGILKTDACDNHVDYKPKEASTE